MNDFSQIRGVVGKDIKFLYLEASAPGKIEEIFVEYSNGAVTKYERGALSYSAFNADIAEGFKNIGVNESNRRTNWLVLNKDNIPKNILNFDKEEELFLELDDAKSAPDVKNVKYNKTKIATAAGMVVLAGALIGTAVGLSNCSALNGSNVKTNAANAIELETGNFNPEIGALEGASIGNVEVTATTNEVEVTENATQKAFESASLEFLMNYNNSEDWMYSEITKEMAEDLEKSGLEILDNEAIFGFSAEELNAFRLVYGNYTQDELVSITGGEFINTTDMINSSESDLNKAFRKIQIAYFNTDKEHLDIVKLAGFSDEEIERIEHYETMLYNYKNLFKEGKKDEAEALMREIRQDIYDYGYASNEGQDKAKGYILKTIIAPLVFYSEINGYKNDVTLHLYNGETGEYEDKVVRTKLFDEIMMRDLCEGYEACEADGEVLREGFNAVEYLKKFNINTNKYTIVKSDDGISKVDQFNDGLVNKLDEFNSYLEKIRNENAMADGATTVNSVNPISNNSIYDTLTKGTKTYTEMNDLINSELMENEKYPKNISFFTSSYAKFVKEALQFAGIIDKDGNFIGKETIKMTNVRGTYITETVTRTRTESHTETFTVKEAVSAEEMAKEEAIKRAEAIERASKTFVIDGETGKDKETTHQDIYNYIWNQNAAQNNNLKTNIDANDMIKNNDANAQKVANWALEDAKDNQDQNAKAAEGAKESWTDANGANHYISGGDEHKDPEYQNADTKTESEAERYNRELAERKALEEANANQNNSAPVVETPVVNQLPAEEAPSGYGNYDPTIYEGYSEVLVDEEIDRALGH